MKALTLGAIIAMILSTCLVGLTTWLFFSLQGADSSEYLTPGVIDTIEFIKDNAASIPITSVVLTNKTSCPPGYISTPYGYFAGLSKGYICNDGFTFACSQIPATLAGQCGKYEEMSVESPGRLDMWGKWNMKLCIKRTLSNNIVFLDKSRPEAASCPSGFKPCSDNICLLNTEDCPIVDITFASTKPDNFEQDPNQKERIISLDGKKDMMIYIRRGNGPNGPVGFVKDIGTIIGDGPCMNPNEQAKRRNNYSCILENANRSGCVTYGKDTENVVFLDTQNEVDTYNRNKINFTTTSWADFLNYNQDQIRLLAYKKIPVVSYSTCASMDLTGLTGFKSALTDLIDLLQKAIISLGGLSLIVFLVALITFNIVDRNKIRTVLTVVGYALIFTGISLIVVFLLGLEKSNSLGEIVALTFKNCVPLGKYQNVIVEVEDNVAVTTKKLKLMLNSFLIASGGTILVGLFLVFCLYTLKRTWKDTAHQRMVSELGSIPPHGSYHQTQNPRTSSFHGNNPSLSMGNRRDPSGSRGMALVAGESPFPYYHHQDL